MRLVAGFHVRDDDWILLLKLQSLAFCERVVVLMDRCGSSTEEICRRFPNVEALHHENTLGLPDLGDDGPICEEGIMRQRVWDEVAKYSPDWVLLGDADEIFTPDVVSFFESPPDVDLCYVHVVQLFKTPGQYIGGQRCVWSHEFPGSNKKGALVRFDRRVHLSGGYRYDLNKFRHCRIEPSPLHPARAVMSQRHVLIPTPKLVHWKWVNWKRWESSFQATLPKYVRYFDGAEIKHVPKQWHWESL